MERDLLALLVRGEPVVLAAMVFDLDGVLVDSEPAWDLATDDLLREFGTRYTDADRRALHGVALSDQSRYLGQRLGIDPATHALATRLVSHLGRHTAAVQPIDGIIEVLRLVRRHIPVAVVTNSPRAIALASLAALPSELRPTVVISADDVAPKPAPDGYLACRDALMVEGPHCRGRGLGPGSRCRPP